MPWGRADETASDVAALAVADSRGMLAVACWEQPTEGVRIDAVDLIAPLLAIPVRRGATRVTPGTRLSAPSPIRVVGDVAEAHAGGAMVRVTRSRA